MRWHLCQRQVEVTGQSRQLDRTILFEELRKLKVTVTDVEYNHNLVGNRFRLIVKVRLASEQGLEPVLTRLESLAGMQSVKVERIG